LGVCVTALVTAHSNGMISASYYIVICDLPGCTIFPKVSNKQHICRKIYNWT